MFFARRPSPRDFERIVAGQATLAMTYTEIGASLGELPPGYRHGRYTVDLGHGDAVFDAAVDAVRRWRAHRGAGIELWPSVPPIEEATVVGQLIRVGPLYAIACCRLVRVVDEPERFGFAYGTLPVHPERGEEAFTVVRDGDAVRFEVAAFSRPQHLLSRVGAPVTRFVQDRVSRRYLAGVRNAVDQGPGP